jgi:iron complex transport system substrate-binding protein
MLCKAAQFGRWAPAFTGMTLWAVGASATPTRIVSLNLCTDEYLLLTARSGQIASISRLGADPHESPLAVRARGLATNNGQLGDVIGATPDLVLTMGAGPQDKALAARLGMRLIPLPYPQSPAEVARQVEQVAALVGNPSTGVAFAREVQALADTAPARSTRALMIGGGGLAPAMGGLAAGWLRLAGLQQRQSGPVAMETLLADPPPVLVMNQYRPGQFSQPQAWTSHPALARLTSRRVATDGRAFLCGGAAMPAEIRRLRAALAQ